MQQGLGGDDVAGRRQLLARAQHRRTRLGDLDRVEDVARLGLVEADGTEVVEQRGRLELVEVRGRHVELAAHTRGEGRDALRVALAHETAELGRGRERADGLLEAAPGRREELEGVPRREQRDGEEERAPESEVTLALDPAVSDRHQDPAGDDREVGGPVAK